MTSVASEPNVCFGSNTDIWRAHTNGVSNRRKVRTRLRAPPLSPELIDLLSSLGRSSHKSSPNVRPLQGPVLQGAGFRPKADARLLTAMRPLRSLESVVSVLKSSLSASGQRGALIDFHFLGTSKPLGRYTVCRTSGVEQHELSLVTTSFAPANDGGGPKGRNSQTSHSSRARANLID